MQDFGLTISDWQEWSLFSHPKEKSQQRISKNKSTSSCEDKYFWCSMVSYFCHICFYLAFLCLCL